MTIRSVATDSRDALAQKRLDMVERQLGARGIHGEPVLRAMQQVAREAFTPPELAEFAYTDAPLPIAEGQTISQPYIVALMAQALELHRGDRVLEIGTGSGYAAAVVGRIAAQVITLERHAGLAAHAIEALHRAGSSNVEVHPADGSHGWPDGAPYDAIVATAAPPEIPQPLLDQLAIGGRLVVPVGSEGDVQILHRTHRTAPDGFEEEDLGAVQFVPSLAGLGDVAPVTAPTKATMLPERIATAAEPFEGVDSAEVGALIERIGPATLVLIGEASHGTREFYRMRQRISHELIERHGFSFVAAERLATMPVTEQPLPQWATTRPSSPTGRPRSVAARSTDHATDRRWKPKRRMPQSAWLAVPTAFLPRRGDSRLPQTAHPA